MKNFALIVLLPVLLIAGCTSPLSQAEWIMLGKILLGAAVATIPSVIVGMTKHPKAAGVLKAILTVLQYLSVLVHADGPGTLKLPLTASPPPGA